MSALTAADTGMADLKTIIRQSTRCLKPGGRLLLEHGYDQQAQVTELLEKEGYTEIVLLADYNHIPRAVLTRWAPDRCQQAQEGSKMENE
jgi:release factor glutamine methyltransferase